MLAACALLTVAAPTGAVARPATAAPAVATEGPIDPAVLLSDLATSVLAAARVFWLPLVVLVIVALYLVVQGRAGRRASPLAAETPKGGDDDEREYLL